MHPVTKRRKKVIALARQYCGDKCEICGYNKCPQALEFHHVEPKLKSFQIGSGSTWALDKMLAEADKCVLLCANCHREYHAGMISKIILSEALARDLPLRKERAETIIGKPKQPQLKKCDCGASISFYAKQCRKCSAKSKQVIDWPDIDTLQRMVNQSSFLAVGRELGVSDNSVRKRMASQAK